MRRAHLVGLVPLLVASTLPAQHATPLSTATIAARATKASVTIVAIGAAGDTLGQGSGYIAKSDGVVVTNWHVVAGAARLTIVLGSGERFEKTLFIDGDSTADVALLRVPGFDLPTLPSQPHVPPVGSHVVVVGTPFGLDHTVTEGIVSAVRVSDGKQLIQMSAPVSPGSSGGPVVNEFGQVVAITRSSLVRGQQLNFAVPIGYALSLLSTAPAPRPIADVLSTVAREKPATATSLGGNGRPVASDRPRAALVGTYRVRTARQPFGASTAPIVNDGWLILGPEDTGWFMLNERSNFVAYVFGTVATASGRVALNANRVALEGFQTTGGMFLEGRDTVDHVAIALNATLVDLPLAVRAGIYDAQVTTEYQAGSFRGTNTAWHGTVVAVSTLDSVRINLHLANAAGGSTGAIFITPITPEGRFAWASEDFKKRLVGRMLPGRIEADWYDERDNGGRYRGSLTARRR